MTEDLKRLVLELKDELRLFHLLSDEEVEKLAPYFEKINLPARSVLFSEGDPGDYIGFVLSGRLEVKKETEFKGKQIVLALLEKGSFVGELSMLDGHPRSATVVALEDSEILILRRSALDAFIQEYPETGIKVLKGIIRVLSLRLRKVVDRLASIF